MMTSLILEDTNDVLIKESQRINIDYSRAKDGRTAVSVLTIEDLAKTDEGIYKCIGINYVENFIEAVNFSDAFVTIQGN